MPKLDKAEAHDNEQLMLGAARRARIRPRPRTRRALFVPRVPPPRGRVGRGEERGPGLRASGGAAGRFPPCSS